MSLVWTLGLLVVAVLVTPPLTRFLGRDTGYPLALVYLAATAAFWPAVTTVMAGETVSWTVAWIPDLDVNLALRADGVGVLFTLIALVIGAVVFLYSARYLQPGRQLSFYLVMAAFTLSMVGLALADDLILLFLCWELTSLASFLLIARSGQAGEPASMRTLLLTFVGGLTLLAAVTAIIVRTGTTSVTEALAHPVWQEDLSFSAVMAVLVLLSAFTKSAQFPFHSWLPDAMAAATPVSAYLHAAAVVKAGIFLMMRFSPAFHEIPVWNYTLISVGLFTSVLGGWFALQKTDLKKLMAYSTVSQLGLITAAIGVGTEAALMAATIHTIAHALFKSGLFMMVGVVDHAAHTRDIRRLPALRRAMPWSFAVTVLGCASMAGVPPMLGFVSKESVLTAMGEAPGVGWFAPAALAVATAGAVLTFAYCAKIVLGAFVDGPEPGPEVTEAAPALLGPAALPIVVGLPLAFLVGLLDTPVARTVEASLLQPAPEVHLTLWHGFTLELFLSVLVYALGGMFIVNRHRLRPRIERDTFPLDGAGVIARLVSGCVDVGQLMARPVRVDHPTRQLAVMFAMFAAVVLGGTWAVAGGSGLLPQVVDLSRPIDTFLLVAITVGVLVMCRTDSRIGATVALSTVGIAVTVQLFALGAPDVGLTQLLVESLTIIFIMLVLQKLPRGFGRPPRLGHGAAAALALLAGLAAGVGVWALTGRRERSDIAGYYVDEGPVETGGSNIVNTILVEFRALDTLGELTVLGMAGIAIIAVLSTIRDRFLDPDREIDPSPTAEVPLRPAGSPAHAAMEEPWANVVPLKLVLRLVLPLLAAISAILFWRGHNEPGGGFIAALVASVVVGLAYLSTGRDRQVGPPRLPVFLIGLGILIAIGTGVWGLLAAGSFLQPLHGEVLGQQLSSALVFDLGVYLAVLGLVMVAFNLLGTSEASHGGERTRERVDETVEGELAGPLDTVRGERPRLTASSTLLADGAPPREGPR
jgi:multicomponent Na+:H+ antiporter subunit A